ncbi:transcriptional regulator [Acinetobacter rudis]|uniref:Transcriptional regulator n=1 Tax=Acinetobacter rudis TaxID=632955 RepID=A0AAW8J9D7_9GAMM|nr:transcriptional regulator [Acinetobacter rudis]MDQ8936687.1 transcriptional regulator [Acinetobacter rudis]MDQ8952397.1 transcriptional regulator [Acinetobacter rudis]MDQ9018897.1 transcriptional regulator [Acinetobacter rudis]
MNLCNRLAIPAQSLQTTHFVNLESVQAAPLLKLPQEEQPSLFRRSLRHHQRELLKIAKDAGMAIGITDHQGTLLWTWSSQQMLSSAEQAHFVEGGHWSTQAVGTNAIGLALNNHVSSCVYSHENQMQSVRDWVCYAAPIVDPVSGQFHGIINLSTKYKKHTSLGVLAVERCAELLKEAIQFEQKNVLYIKALGTPQVLFNQQILPLTHRQIEILSILAIKPEGIALNELHAALYGDRNVSEKTLKAELSQLRTLLPDCIMSRPYKLSCEVQCDFLSAERSLDAGFLASTFSLYKGSFLVKSESPILSTWRECFDARLSHLIYQMQDIDPLLKLVGRIPEQVDAIYRLLELLPSDSLQRVRIEKLL